MSSKRKKDKELYERGYQYISTTTARGKKSKILDLKEQLHLLKTVDPKDIPQPVIQPYPVIQHSITHAGLRMQNMHDQIVNAPLNVYSSTRLLMQVAKLEELKQRVEQLQKSKQDKEKAEKKKQVKPPEISPTGVLVYHTEDHEREKYEFEDVLGKPPFLFILCAPPGGGKTNLLVNFINILFKDLIKPKDTYIFSGNNGMDDTLAANTSIPEENYIGASDDSKSIDLNASLSEANSGAFMQEKIIEILTKQIELVEQYGKVGAPHIHLVFEDMGGAKQFMHAQLLTTIAGLMRHLNCSMTITTWGLSMVDFNIRRMCNGIAIYRLANHQEEEAVIDQLALLWLAGSDTRVNAARVAMKAMYENVIAKPEMPNNFIWFNRRARHKEEFREGLFKVLKFDKLRGSKTNDVLVQSEFLPGWSDEKVIALLNKKS